jgi:hypothetical protein
MHHDEDESDFHEDWSSTGDDLANCPECGAEVYLELNDSRCPECGHWFLESDRARMWQQGEGRLLPIYKLAAILALMAILLPLLLQLLQ